MDTGLTELLGYAAAGLVLATFSARSIRALRALAIASDLLFIAYAACAALMPVLVLHALLLPMNVIRLRQALADSRRVAAELDGSCPGRHRPETATRPLRWRATGRARACPVRRERVRRASQVV